MLYGVWKINGDDDDDEVSFENIADIVRCGRLRWFGYFDSVDDWVWLCRNIVIVGAVVGTAERHEVNVWGKKKICSI